MWLRPDGAVVRVREWNETMTKRAEKACETRSAQTERGARECDARAAVARRPAGDTKSEQRLHYLFFSAFSLFRKLSREWRSIF